MRRCTLLFVIIFSFPIAFIAQGQDSIRIYGTISDSQGKPIPYAHIILSESNTGTLSNSSGDFSLLISNCKSTVLISHVGYKSKFIQSVCGKSEYTIFLDEDVTKLQAIEVRALNARQVVKKAAEALKSNYSIDSINYTIFTRITEKTEVEPIILQEFVFDMFSQKSVNNQFHIINGRARSYNKLGNKKAKKDKVTGVKSIETHLMLKYIQSFLQLRKMKRYHYSFLEDVFYDNQIFYRINVVSLKNDYTKGGELWIHPENFGITYIKTSSENETWLEESIVNRVRETYFRPSNEKWILSHSFYNFILIPEEPEQRIYHNQVVVVTDTHPARQFDKADKLEYYHERYSKFYNSFENNFWESFNYIPLDSAFKSSLTGAKNP